MKLDYVGTSIQLGGPKYEHSIRATLNAPLAYGPVFMQCTATCYVPFHTGLGIIKFTSLLQQFVSESRKRWGWAGVKTRIYGTSGYNGYLTMKIYLNIHQQ